jgi:hypothetical protein
VSLGLLMIGLVMEDLGQYVIRVGLVRLGLDKHVFRIGIIYK